MIQKLINWFQQHPEISILGFFLGLILGIWSLVVGIKSRNRKKLAISVTGNNLIQDFSEKINGLIVNFKNEKVKNLTVTRIVIWNNGNQTLHSNDLIQANPLRIVSKDDVSILDFQIIQENEASNQFEIFNAQVDNEKTQSLYIRFDYIDPAQGCVIQIIHNGNSFSDVTVTGKLKGIDEISKIDGARFVYRLIDLFALTSNRRTNKIISGLSFITLAIVLLAASLFFSNIERNLTFQEYARYLIVILVLPYFYIGFKILLFSLPKGLDSFNERI